MTTIGHYFSAHGDNTERALLLGLSFLIKLVKYVSVYILFVRLTGPAVSFHSFYLFCFGVAGAELSSLLPVQGLAGFGTWEAAFAFGRKSKAWELMQKRLPVTVGPSSKTCPR